MPCKEMKEFEASFNNHIEATSIFNRIYSGSSAGVMPYREARVAYVMQVHRRSCPSCKSANR
jgi:hypothetical protein